MNYIHFFRCISAKQPIFTHAKKHNYVKMCTISPLTGLEERRTFAPDFFTTIIMIEILQNEVQTDNYEKVVPEVLSQLTTGKDKHDESSIGTAYIDWGVTGDFYQNCPSRSIADKVARAFKEMGYYVYIQRMGFGSRRIAEGTPITYCIHKQVRIYNNWEEL